MCGSGAFCDWARGLDDVSLSDAQEAANSTVNVRTRDNAVHGTKSVDALIAEFKREAVGSRKIARPSASRASCPEVASRTTLTRYTFIVRCL